MLPVVGYNDGAGRVERMKRAYLFSTLFSSALMLFCAIPICIAAPDILRLLTHDTDAIPIGTLALRAQGAVLVTHGTVTCTILFLQAVGKNFLGTLLAAARQGIFFLPLIFTLPSAFGINGLSLTQPISDLLTFLFSLPFFFYSLRLLQGARKRRAA
jgi:Na+-driven multidrug efflux pump